MARLAPTSLLLDYTQDKIAVLDERGTFTYCNEAAERILGFDPASLIGENAFDYVHPEERSAVRETFESVIDSDAEFVAETATYRHQHRDGSWVWLESRVSNLTDSELSGYVVSSREVTDRVEAERQKAETEGRLRELANTTDDVLWMFDADWTEVLFVNPAYESLFGDSIESLRADPESFIECVHPADREVVRQGMERLSTGEPVDMEYRVNPTTDYNRSVWVQGEPVTEDGDVVRIVGFARDITERHRRERQLAVMDNLLRHNLRNELNVVLGYAEDIDEDAGTGDRDAIGVIRQAGQSLLETAEKQREIVDLLSRPANPRSLDLVEAVTAAIETTASKYPETTIETDLPDAVTVTALQEIEFAVIELLENAIRHADAPPAIRVSISRQDEGVELLVVDNCAAIPTYDRRVLIGDHDMDPVNHSSGCGLWLVYWIVDLSGGSIEVDPGTPTGNEIRIILRADAT